MSEDTPAERLDERPDHPMLVETARLILRRFDPGDLEHLVELDADPEVMRFLNGGAPTPRDVVRNEILPRFLAHDSRFPICGFWAAISRNTESFIGWFALQLRSDSSPATAELGFRLRRSTWGAGLATEGARALVRAAFVRSEIERICAQTFEENVGSRRVLEKTGLQLVRRFRMSAEELESSGTYASPSADLWDGDDLEYRLEKSEWSSRFPEVNLVGGHPTGR